MPEGGKIPKRTTDPKPVAPKPDKDEEETKDA